MQENLICIRNGPVLYWPQERLDLSEIHILALTEKNLCEVRFAWCRLCLWEAGIEAI